MWYAIIPSKLENVMQGWVNVADRGIIGDGVTDVTDALNSLIEEIATWSSAILYFPPGVYVIEGDVDIWGSISFVGAMRYWSQLVSHRKTGRLIIDSNYMKIANFLLSGIQICSPGGYRSIGYGVTIENCWMRGRNDLFIDMGLYGGTIGSGPGLVIRDCLFEKEPTDANCGKIAISSPVMPVLIENCSFISITNENSPWVEMGLGGYQVTLRNISWLSLGGNGTLVSTVCNVLAENISYDVAGGTKTLFDIRQDGQYVVASGIRGQSYADTFNLATGYKDNLINLDEFAWRGRNPAGASLWLPTRRSTTSTSYVTLKSFRTTIAGEIRVKAQYGNTGPEPGYEVYIRVLKNGNQVYQGSTYSNYTNTPDIDIPCSRGDLIEFQGRTTSGGNPMNLYQAWVWYIPIRAGDFYEVTD
jgi:hypothetical protein